MNTSSEILWFNQNIMFEKKLIFFKNWFQSGTVYIKDIFRNGTFRNSEQIRNELKYGKSNVFFDFAKLKKAIPKKLLEKENNCQLERTDLQIPRIFNGDKIKRLHELTGKQYYNILSLNDGVPRCCLYWEKYLDKDIDWPNCLKRNLVNMQENKLKEFHFKILYNLIPVRKNILKWNFSPDDLCKSCNESEDIIHAFYFMQM